MESLARKVEPMLDVARRRSPSLEMHQQMTRAKARWVISSKTPKASPPDRVSSDMRDQLVRSSWTSPAR